MAKNCLYGGIFTYKNGSYYYNIFFLNARQAYKILLKGSIFLFPAHEKNVERKLNVKLYFHDEELVITVTDLPSSHAQRSVNGPAPEKSTVVRHSVNSNKLFS